MPNKKKANIINFPTSPSKLERQVEAILFAASEPLDIDSEPFNDKLIFYLACEE